MRFTRRRNQSGDRGLEVGIVTRERGRGVPGGAGSEAPTVSDASLPCAVGLQSSLVLVPRATLATVMAKVPAVPSFN